MSWSQTTDSSGLKRSDWLASLSGFCHQQKLVHVPEVRLKKQLKIATRAVCYFEVIYANEQKTISVKYVYSITSQRRIKNSYKNIKVDKVDLVNVCDSMIALPA